jgi:predicted protein tyrosine phosphatase
MSAGWRAWQHRHSTRLYGPSRSTTWLSWVGDERLAIGSLPTAATLTRLVDAGVTHVVNCRAPLQTWISQDLAVERALLGPSRVAHAPMWDTGRPQDPRRWAEAVRFAARALDADPAARVLVHCQQGRRRSVLVAYAVLRVRGRSADEAAALVLLHRVEAELVPAYRASVERWLADAS